MFYGWWMVAISFAAQFIAAGVAFYALPRLLVPLADEFAGGERAGQVVEALGLGGIDLGAGVPPLEGQDAAGEEPEDVCACGQESLPWGRVPLYHARCRTSRHSS